MDNTADDRYVPRDAFNAQKAKAAGLDACVTWLRSRLNRHERGWTRSVERAPTKKDAQFGMVYVFYGHSFHNGGFWAELTRWEHVAERPDNYPLWHSPPPPPIDFKG